MCCHIARAPLLPKHAKLIRVSTCGFCAFVAHIYLWPLTFTFTLLTITLRDRWKRTPWPSSRLLTLQLSHPRSGVHCCWLTCSLSCRHSALTECCAVLWILSLGLPHCSDFTHWGDDDFIVWVASFSPFCCFFCCPLPNPPPPLPLLTCLPNLRSLSCGNLCCLSEQDYNRSA